jgi:multidrug efflux pump subunit AcrA (membrane-fusion protein)
MNADATTNSPDNSTLPPPARSRRWVLIAVIVLAVLAVALLAGWLPHYYRNKAVNAAADEQRSTLPVVAVQTVHRAPAEQTLSLPGTVSPQETAHVYARAAGYLKTRYVDLGDNVHNGQLLAVIAAPDLDATVAQQDAAVQQSRDEVSTARSQLQLQQASYTRVHTLVLHGVLSQQDDDAAHAAMEMAESSLQAAEHAVQVAQGAQSRARSLAEFEQIRSPISGTITARNVEVGSLVSPSGGAEGLAPAAGMTGGPPTGGAQGGELFDVTNLDRLEVFISVPEQDALFVQNGQPVDLSFAEIPGQTFVGDVVRTSRSLSQQSRTLLAEVHVEDTHHQLRPGMFASALMHYKDPNPAILISGDSLLTMARGQFVPVVENNVVEMRAVRVGRDLGTQVYVVAGLRDGDTIVLNPNDQVKEGARVTTRPAPAGQQGDDASAAAGGKDAQE